MLRAFGAACLAFHTRLLASLALLIALAGMGLAQEQKPAATAQPSAVLPDLLPGEGWQELPLEPDDAGSASLATRAWSDPADGCHLVSFQLPIPATAQIDPLVESFTKALAKDDLAVSDVEGIGDSRWLSLAGAGLHGIANVQLQRQSPTEGNSRASAQACYWNHREPERCRAICKRVLGRVPGQVTP